MVKKQSQPRVFKANLFVAYKAENHQFLVFLIGFHYTMPALKEYCRSIYWPNFNIVVSQGMGEGHTIGIEMREQLVGEAVRIHTTFIKFSVLRKLGSWAPKQL